MSEEDLQAEIERLRAENARLKDRRARGISMRVSEKGALSVYGLGRFPVTLYREQWARLLDSADDIRAFIAENEDVLNVKGEAVRGDAAQPDTGRRERGKTRSGEDAE